MGNPFSNSAGSPPTSTSQLANLYKSYVSFLPGLQNVSNQQLLPTALSQLNTNLATTPIQNAENLQQLDQYGIPTAAANSAITNQNALNGAQTNLNTILGPGGESAIAAQGLNQLTNPNYFQNANAAANQSTNLLNSVNLNGLSPGEYNSAERALNNTNTATGNLGLNNPTNTLSNALNFGGAFNAKQGILNNALGTSASVGNMLQNNGFNSTSTALASPNPNNISGFGAGSFGSTGPNGQQNLSNPLLGVQGSITGGTTAPLAQSAFQNSPAGMFQTNSSACCFIFMEAYKGQLPLHVRKCRDRYYRLFPRIAKGYCRMAKILVPLMRHYNFVRSTVWKYMVHPMTLHGFSVINNFAPFKRKGVRSFWMRTWYILGI